MLKITDSSGELVGILEDEDSAPKMIEKDKTTQEIEDENEEEEEQDGNTTVGTVRTVSENGSGSSETASGGGT